MSDRSRYTIRTSDRRVFRRCLRKWGFQSSLKGNWKRKGVETNINFWFGSAIHFAMEDYFGENKYGDPRRAFWAYYQAFPYEERPSGHEFMYEVGVSMLSYFLPWYQRHNEVTGFETAWFDPETNTMSPTNTNGKLQRAIEFSFLIPLGLYAVVDQSTDQILYTEDYCDNEDFNGEPYLLQYNGKQYYVKKVPLFYHGTMDRIVVDKYGRYWILDYKTAKGADTNKLETDDQISAYLWAFRKIFGFEAHGFIYLQLTKEPVQEPKRLKNGELSVDKRQKTTYSLVKQEIIKDYGSVQNAPGKVIDFLNHMAELETPEGDKFIRWDFVRRTPEQLDFTEKNIYGELRAMLNPDLYQYPSPTRDCIWDCPCRDYCLAMERGDQTEVELFLTNFEKRPHQEDGNIEPWRDNLPEVDPDNLISLEEIINYDMQMKIEFESKADEDDNSGFKFMYGDDDDEC